MSYCLACGHETVTENKQTFCINNACWLYGIVVKRSYASKPKDSELRKLRLKK